MVKVFVRHKDVVGLGEGGIIDDQVAHFAHRVDFNLFSVEFDADAGVCQRVKLERFPTFCGEGVRFVVFFGGTVLSAGHDTEDQRQEDKGIFHSVID